MLLGVFGAACSTAMRCSRRRSRCFLYSLAEHPPHRVPGTAVFMLSRATVIPTSEKGMMLWRERLFATMARNARTAGDYPNVPSGRIIELGTKVEIGRAS